MRKTLVRVLSVSIAALLLAGCGGGEGKTDATPKESWLFSLQSAGTTDFDQSSGVFSVPVGNLVGFSDRPFRDIQDLTLTDFVALWDDTSKDSFSADPPNAALTYWDSDATDAVAHTVIVEITGPVSSAGNVVSMTLQILSPSGAVLPTKMYWASLFIDNAATATATTAACAAAKTDWAAKSNAFYDAPDTTTNEEFSNLAEAMQTAITNFTIQCMTPEEAAACASAQTELNAANPTAGPSQSVEDDFTNACQIMLDEEWNLIGGPGPSPSP